MSLTQSGDSETVVLADAIHAGRRSGHTASRSPGWCAMPGAPQKMVRKNPGPKAVIRQLIENAVDASLRTAKRRDFFLSDRCLDGKWSDRAIDDVQPHETVAAIIQVKTHWLASV